MSRVFRKDCSKRVITEPQNMEYYGQNYGFILYEAMAAKTSKLICVRICIGRNFKFANKKRNRQIIQCTNKLGLNDMFLLMFVLIRLSFSNLQRDRRSSSCSLQRPANRQPYLSKRQNNFMLRLFKLFPGCYKSLCSAKLMSSHFLQCF